MTNNLLIRTVKIHNLARSYSAYFDALRENEKKWISLQFEPSQETPKLTFLRGFALHIVRIVFARSHAVARTGSILAFFRTRWDPIILETTLDCRLMGYCFIERQSAEVFQVSIITGVGHLRARWVEHDILAAALNYMKSLGATRIFVRTSSDEMASILKKCEFNLAFQDSILFLDF